MKLINGILYLEMKDAVDCGMNENYLRKAKSTGVRSFTFMDDPTDNRKVLIEYDSLKDRYKEMVQKRYGNNPYERMSKEPIKNMVQKDVAAETFFMQYRFEDNKHLPIDIVRKYTTAASWLNMLLKSEADKKDIKKLLNLNLADFWVKVCEVIKDDAIDLPATYQRLREKMQQYKADGYSVLIHKQFGHKKNLKVSSELAESVLLELLSMPNQHDTAVIARAYNKWAVENNHEPISSKTVWNWQQKHSFNITGARNGSKEWYNVFGKQIMRARPSAPLLLIGSDDNDLDLYFRSEKYEKGKKVVNHYNRVKLIVVMDAYNDYILGYAFAPTVTAELVKLAYLDAMHHVHQLTNGYYLPHQIQTDRWGKGTLDEFYKSLATYTPATAKVARAKYIERAFGVHWHQQLKLYPNYAGSNITSQYRINEDNLLLVKQDFPDLDNAHFQVADFVQRMRTLVNEQTGKTRQQQWVESFVESEKAQQKRIDETQMLLLLGTTHNQTNTITNKGLTPAINCVERTYEIPNDLYLQNVGKKVQIIYDPLDYSRILVTDHNNLRFIAHQYDKLPSAIADFKPGDRTRLNDKIEEKKQHVLTIINQRTQRQSTLAKHKMDAESLLQAGVMQKGLMQATRQQYDQLQYGGTDADGFDDLDKM